MLAYQHTSGADQSPIVEPKAKVPKVSRVLDQQVEEVIPENILEQQPPRWVQHFMEFLNCNLSSKARTAHEDLRQKLS